MLEHKTRRVANVTIVDLAGRISLSRAAFGLDGGFKIGDLVQQLMREGETSIVLNLAEVSYIDSSGIANMFRAYTSAERQGCVLKILNPTKVVRGMLDAPISAASFPSWRMSGKPFSPFTPGTDSHGNVCRPARAEARPPAKAGGLRAGGLRAGGLRAGLCF